MSRGTAYYDLPNGERIELPTTMPDVEEVPDLLLTAIHGMIEWWHRGQRGGEAAWSLHREDPVRV